MSEELLKDDDVEGHKHKFKGTDEPGSDDSSDDVEAHRHKFK